MLTEQPESCALQFTPVRQSEPPLSKMPKFWQTAVKVHRVHQFSQEFRLLVIMMALEVKCELTAANLDEIGSSSAEALEISE